jgi:aspartate racemase
MTRHIGIAACSAEGAALCYRTICAEGEALLGSHAHPEISMHTPSLSLYVECLKRGDRQGVADLVLTSAHKLAGAGADFLICPDNTIHDAIGLVLPHSPLPWLHIAEVVAEEASRRGFQRIGILGTRWLVDSDVYPQTLAARGLGFMRPSGDERDDGSHHHG